ncbi:hypothetical protein [Qipengyuania sp. 902]|uniref:hypothetical protein n=1 Tax=Qipengyuania sp. 902 TaxID=3417565 RepID=UPI003EB6F92F
MAQNIQCATVVQLLAETVAKHIKRCCTVRFLQSLPYLRLRLLQPVAKVFGEERTLAVIACRSAFLVDPTSRAKVVADFVLEDDFLVQAHSKLTI